MSSSTTEESTSSADVMTAVPITEESWFLVAVIGGPLLLVALIGGAVAACVMLRKSKGNDRPSDDRMMAIADDREMDSAVFTPTPASKPERSSARMSIYGTAPMTTFDIEQQTKAGYGVAPALSEASSSAPTPASEYYRPPAAITNASSYGAPPAALAAAAIAKN